MSKAGGREDGRLRLRQDELSGEHPMELSETMAAHCARWGSLEKDWEVQLSEVGGVLWGDAPEGSTEGRIW